MFPVKKRPTVIPIDRELDAEYLKSVLKDREIPHTFVSYYDSAYGGIFQLQNGWGHVEVPIEHVETVKQLYDEVREAEIAPEEQGKEENGNSPG